VSYTGITVKFRDLRASVRYISFARGNRSS